MVWRISRSRFGPGSNACHRAGTWGGSHAYHRSRGRRHGRAGLAVQQAQDLQPALARGSGAISGGQDVTLRLEPLLVLVQPARTKGAEMNRQAIPAATNKASFRMGGLE